MDDKYKELFKQALSLPMYERRALAHRIINSLQTEEHAISASERYKIIRSVVEKVLEHKISNSRHHLNVLSRMYIACIMQQDGYSTSVIGKLMKRDHTTIVQLQKRMKDMISVPAYYKKELEQYNTINQLLANYENQQ